MHFYPRPPRGGRQVDGILADTVSVFLSTPSARRATEVVNLQTKGREHFYPRPPRGGRPRSALRPSNSTRHFYPRPPRGGRPRSSTCRPRAESISIHALREEGDYTRSASTAGVRAFLSTPSARRATDLVTGMASGMKHFYPRPPRGGRPGEQTFVHVLESFLSTPSARRAT